ncbi:MAG: hypothetical protein M0C28_42775 [Candidatus Moduliflexus flocculans]|nr:hypothetical protein [Candidatus Moduliflexus flocculans]
MESVNTKAAEADQLEAHEALADKIIDALRGDDGEAETARGLVDLNTHRREVADRRSSKAPSPARARTRPGQILAHRNQDRASSPTSTSSPGSALKPEVLTFLKEKTFLGKMTVLSRETVGPQVGADLRRKAVQATIWSLHRACSSTSPCASSSSTASRPSSPWPRTS